MHIVADKIFVEELNKEFGLNLEYKDFKNFYSNKVKPLRDKSKKIKFIDSKTDNDILKSLGFK